MVDPLTLAYAAGSIASWHPAVLNLQQRAVNAAIGYARSNIGKIGQVVADYYQRAKAYIGNKLTQAKGFMKHVATYFPQRPEPQAPEPSMFKRAANWVGENAGSIATGALFGLGTSAARAYLSNSPSNFNELPELPK